MGNKPISIQNVKGNVTVTIVEGNNNQTQVSIGDFIEKITIECGLRLIYEDTFKENSNTSTNFNEWLKGFSFNIKSIYYKREYKREKIINTIEKKLEDNQMLLILGESGTSKTILLMEVLCDYLKKGFFKKGYKILHNLDSTATGEIKNLEYLENTVSLLVKDGNNVLVIVDNVHNKSISAIFSLIQKIKYDHEDKLDKIRFLLSARQPEFGWAMEKGIFDSETTDRIDMLFEEKKRYNIRDFTEDEVKGFIEKYKEHLHSSKRNKSIEENAREIYEDTEGHPIMVRFSIFQDGLKTHVKRMYTDYLIENKYPNIERIKSVIACSLYDISSIPLTDESLRIDLDLENASLEIVDTIIRKTGNIWTTIHPRWDLELFQYMFSLNEADRAKIKKAFGFILNKILDIHSGTFKQLNILNTLYKTIAEEQFIDIKIIQEIIKIDDIEKKLDDPYYKVFFFNIVGGAFYTLKDHDNAIVFYDKALEISPNNVDILNNKGLALSAIGRNEEAIECYDKAIEIEPQNIAPYINKVFALADLGRNEQAIECCDKAIEINLQNITHIYFVKGIILSKLGRKEEAIECYDKAIEIDPPFGAYINKGLALSAIGRNEEAIECYDNEIEINPQYADAYFNRGISLYAIGRKEEAIASYDKAIEINPKYADAYFNRGISLYAIGRKEEAIASYDKAIEIDPQYLHAYGNKGISLFALGRNEEAIEYYDKVIEMNPQDALSYNNKGFSLYALGKKEEAIACYDKAIEMNPQFARAYNNKVNALFALGRNEEAIECYDDILLVLGRNEKAIECYDDMIRINPLDIFAYYNKGSALSTLGRYEEAVECYDKIIEIYPEYYGAYNTYFNKGIALSALDRKEEAIANYDKAIEINPEYTDVYFNKGVALSELGKKEEAIACYDKALAIDPQDVDILNNKAFALAELDKNEEALSIIQKVLESNPDSEYYLSTAAFIMYNLKRYVGSRNYYNKALNINPNIKDTLSESELKAFNSVME
jgi:tetratricopeptide (TPR) repeat protein